LGPQQAADAGGGGNEQGEHRQPADEGF